MTEKPGGYRIGAGRKSQWNRPTKMIRVPIEFEAELLAIVHRLDDGLDAGNTGNTGEVEGSFRQVEIESAIDSIVMGVTPPKRRQAIALFKKFRLRLVGTIN